MLRRVAGIERYCNDYCDFEKRASMLLDNNILNVKLDVEVVGMASNGASPKAVSRISSCLPSFYEHYNSSTPLFSQKNTEENTFIKYPVFSETRKKAQGEPTGDDRVQDGKTCLNKFTKNNTASGLADHILIKNGIQGSSTNPELVEAGLENDGALASASISTSVSVVDGHFLSTLKVLNDKIEKWSSFSAKHILLLQAYNLNSSPPAYGKVQLVEPQGVSIISDIDDTIKDSGIFLGKRHVLNATFLHECREVPGMSDVYRFWDLRGACFHYVSNSPWQIFPMIENFFSKFCFPFGSAHLRTWDPRSHKSVFYEPQGAKRESIVTILKDFPRRKFVLIGDSGEMDLELYTSLARDFPQQIIKIFIRLVSVGDISQDNTTLVARIGVSNTNSLGDFTKNSYLERQAPTNVACPISHKGLHTSARSLHPIYTSHSSDIKFDSQSYLSKEPEDLKRKPAENSCVTLSRSNCSHTAQALSFIDPKYQRRVEQCTRALPPQLLTLFSSPHTLLECPIVKMYLDLYPDS